MNFCQLTINELCGTHRIFSGINSAVKKYIIEKICGNLCHLCSILSSKKDERKIYITATYCQMLKTFK